MFSDNNYISLRQLKFLLILDIFGMGFTILPRKLVEFGNQNGWILIIIALIMAGICLFIINSVSKIYPNDSFVAYSSKIMGKPLGIIISFGFIIKILISVALEVRVFSEILNEILLFNTPFWLISLIMLILGAYMASKGFEARGRIAEILIFVIFILLSLVFLVAVLDVDFTNLKPFFNDIEPRKFLKGSIYTLFYFSGIEFILLSYPYVNSKEKGQISKFTFKGLIFVGISILIISIITICKFGKYDILHQMWPVLEIMDTIDFPGSFIERQDAFIMTFWIIAIFMIVNSGVFFSSLIFKDIVKKGSHTMFIYIFVPIIYVISLIPENITQVYYIIDKFYILFGGIYIFIVPLILLLTAKIRGIENENI